MSRALSRVVYRGDVSPPGWVTAPLMVLAATLCAEAVLLPVGAVLFGRVSFAGLVLNFVAIPLMAVTQIAGLAALVLVGFHPLPSLTAGLLAHLAATGLVESTRLLDVWLWLVVNIPPPGPFSLVSYYVALATMFWLDSPGGLRWAARVGWGVAVVWIVTGAVRPVVTGAPGDGWIRVSFLDVGQADATLVQAHGRWSGLVDAGGTRNTHSRVGERVIVPAFWRLGVRRLDLAVLTHGHPDHIGGLPVVLRRLAPHDVWEGVPVAGHAAVAELQAMLVLSGHDGTTWLPGQRSRWEPRRSRSCTPRVPTGSGGVCGTMIRLCWRRDMTT
ncbi:MAG: ComEC/Rec2 family competence protein [Acidobacteriota bacterium]|nr:ComEC/Rec2 family competence protein [Acidobacteriota bacterium]